jgi:hypothetical protein
LSWPSALEIFFGQEPAVLNNLIYQHSSVSQRSASAELADRRPSSPLFSESGRAATREPCAMARNRCAISLPTACVSGRSEHVSVDSDRRLFFAIFTRVSALLSWPVQDWIASGLFFYYFWRAAAVRCISLDSADGRVDWTTYYI